MMCERCEELEEALQRIAQWADAYPEDIFHTPSNDEYFRAHKLLRANGMTLDALMARQKALQEAAPQAPQQIASPWHQPRRPTSHERRQVRYR